MTLSRVALISAAAGFGGFGVACLVAPKNMLERVDVRAKSGRGTTELRAMYGGLELGFAAFFAVAVAKRHWVRPALWAQALSLGGLAASRVAGIAIDRPKGPLMKGLAVAEGSAAVLAAAALARRERTVAGFRAVA